MTCCKVPVKISGFSGGCAIVAAAVASSLTATSLTGITTNGVVAGIAISNLAYLGLKCVNIACPPNLVVADTLGGLAEFLDANLTAVSLYRDSGAAVLAVADATATSAIKAGLAALIAGCGTCCS